MPRNSKPKPERTYIAKTRRCLKCREPFESEWAGERVCVRCKGSSSWREGADFETEWRVAAVGEWRS